MQLAASMVARHGLVAGIVLHLSRRQLAAAFDSWQVRVLSRQKQRWSGSQVVFFMLIRRVRVRLCVMDTLSPHKIIDGPTESLTAAFLV